LLFCRRREANNKRQNNPLCHAVLIY
jgi:hypothetical protein